MRRLVYAPKVYAFIRSHNSDGEIIDVSNDIIEGEVRRVVNDVSTARLVLRNRHKRYLRNQNGRQLFLPMDLITIWLQRIAGKPVQVFTGYLDSVPYYQMYPGNCQITASCTLKKLAYTWFDPGLQFFQNWVQGFGNNWKYDITTGEAINPDLNIGTDVTDPGRPSNQQTDSDFGKLLYSFMKDIALWPEADMVISDLDPKLPKKMADLYRRATQQAEANLAVLTQAMKDILGVTVTQNADGTNTDGTIDAKLKQTMQAMKDNQGRIDLRILVMAAEAVAKMSPEFSRDATEATGGMWGYGLYSFRPEGHTVPRPLGGPVTNVDGYVYENKIDGVPIRNIVGSPEKATQMMVRRLMSAADARANPTTMSYGDQTVIRFAPKTRAQRNKAISDYIQAANSNNAKAYEWIQAALGYEIPQVYLQAATVTATKYVASFNGDYETARNTPTATVELPRIFNFDDPTFTEGDLLSSAEKKRLKDQYKSRSALKEILPFLYAAKSSSKLIKLDYRQNQHPENLYLKVGSKTSVDYLAMQNFINQFEGQTSVPKVVYRGQNEFIKIVKGVRQSSREIPYDEMNLTSAEQGIALGQARITVEEGMEIPQWFNIPNELEQGGDLTLQINDSTAVDNANGNGVQSFTFGQLAQFSANAAFVAQFAFPSDRVESTTLRGESALMNDVSCLDAVKQFSQASLRNFMSLPDGRFMAFYPDYFGSVRKPYWWIRDIEIVNMGIQLNDTSLATHVYTPGDVAFGASNNTIDLRDRAQSRGVVTINTANVLETFINDLYVREDYARGLPTSKLSTADAFLEHYGARPYKEDMPMIRSGSAEFLIAFQTFMLKWASQFATDVTFTFQPEVMAGGIIGFPDHGLQMYVDEVTHSFSYTDGFSTSAVLTAPAIMNDQNQDGVSFLRKNFKDNYPGFALAGNKLSFGYR